MSLHAAALLARHNRPSTAPVAEVEGAAAPPAAMVAVFVPPVVADTIAVPGGEAPADLHVTLAFLGPADALPDPDLLVAEMRRVAAMVAPFPVALTGTGQFTPKNPGDGVPHLALPSSAPLLRLRELVASTVVDKALGDPAVNLDRFAPHVTLKYGPADQPVAPLAADVTFTVDALTVAIGPDRVTIPLAGTAGAVRDVAYTTPRAAPTPTAPAPSAARAFVVEHAGRAFVTGPADVVTAASREGRKVSGQDRMLWVDGRLVGSGEPNRNGALWSPDDLAGSVETVPGSPLNWLHQQRYVIGSLTSALYVPQVEAAADGLRYPYLSTVAGVWEWMYPREATVIRQAAEQGSLYYSMECIAEKVRCTGPNGCGGEFDYLLSRTQPETACDHINNYESVRQLVTPTFRGAAIIVPPVQPGWAQANATVLQAAAPLAEAAWEQAGRPAVAAAEWERVVAQVLEYASRV